MGMSIDESLEWLISRKEHYEMDDDCQELAQALDTSINTMREYQKIENIVNNRYGKSVLKILDEIIKVVEDGNNK
jgi:hypothetical protein